MLINQGNLSCIGLSLAVLCPSCTTSLSCPLSVTSTLSMSIKSRSSSNRKMSGDKSMGGESADACVKMLGVRFLLALSESHQETSPWEESSQSCQSV
jgi:hypothetical protein